MMNVFPHDWKTVRLMKVYLETMGCQMNRLDSELVTASLRAAGHEMVDDHGEAEVVLYNTCSVRRHAEEKAYSRLGGDSRRKAHHRPRLILGVLGCMAQREGQELARRFGQLDIVCGPGQLARLPELIAAAAAGSRAVALDPDPIEARRRGKDPADANRAEGAGADGAAPEGSAIVAAAGGANRADATAASDEADFDALDLARDCRNGAAGAQAYVRVMKGCDNFCTYCIVPLVRGPEQSRRPERIVQEVRRLIDAGVTEITLLGQTVNRYRWSDGGKTVRFSDLLADVADVPHLRRLRFVTSHPLDFTDDILHIMAERANICEYIHLPPQSGSDAVLGRMNRKYTRGQYDELVDRARAIVPGVVLAGDFIVGFPGETEADHEASAELMRRSGFKNSFVFKYSPRPGTAAARNMPDDVPEEVKRRRNNELLAVQQEVGLAHHRSYIGASAEVLVEGPSVRAAKQGFEPSAERTQLVGRTRGDHIVHFFGPQRLAGQYVHVRITEATSLSLRGEKEEGKGD
jgi:tRNA-2-methylthio-N6-dimethylallyladenosine synthase